MTHRRSQRLRFRGERTGVGETEVDTGALLRDVSRAAVFAVENDVGSSEPLL